MKKQKIIELVKETTEELYEAMEILTELNGVDDQYTTLARARWCTAKDILK